MAHGIDRCGDGDDGPCGARGWHLVGRRGDRARRHRQSKCCGHQWNCSDRRDIGSRAFNRMSRRRYRSFALDWLRSAILSQWSFPLMMRLVVIMSCLFAALPALAQDAAQRQRQALPYVIDQRNVALDGLALCQGDLAALQAQLAAIKSELDAAKTEIERLKKDASQ